MAPEVLDGSYTHSADYWSLGCVLYEMFAGNVDACPAPHPLKTKGELGCTPFELNSAASFATDRKELVFTRPFLDRQVLIPDAAWDLITRYVFGALQDNVPLIYPQTSVRRRQATKFERNQRSSVFRRH